MKSGGQLSTFLFLIIIILFFLFKLWQYKQILLLQLIRLQQKEI